MNTATLEFPTIVERADEVVDAAPVAALTISKELALATLRTTAMSELSAVSRGIAELKAKHGATDYDIATPKGYKLATERRHAIRQVRYKVPHVVKARKAELKEIGEAVGTEGDRIVAALKAIEDPHDLAIEAEDTRRAAEAARLKALNDERIARHESAIAAIRGCVARAQGLPSARIADGIEKVAAIVIDPAVFEEFAVPAANAQCETLEAMRKLFDAAKAQEDAEEAREAQRVEQARIAEEQRVESERLATIAADVKKAADKLAADMAAFEAKQRAAAEPEVVEPPAPAPPPAEPAHVEPIGQADEEETVYTDETARFYGNPRFGTSEHFGTFVVDLAPAEIATVERAAISQVTPEEDDLIRLLTDLLVMVKHTAEPFAGKFPAQPKQSPEWWASLRAQVESLQPRIAIQLEALT